MTKCVFCGKDKPLHIGIHVIKNTGTVNYFCSSKCRKNTEKLKRDKRKVRWTEAFHITREKARAKVKAAKEAKAAKEKETPKEEAKLKKTVKKTKK